MSAAVPTQLVCTIGPGSAARVPELVAAGMDVARINFSHGTPHEHAAAAAAVRAAAQAAGRSIGILIDLPGPKIRLGLLAGGEVQLVVGEPFILMAGRRAGDRYGATTTHAGLAADLRPGDPVYLADGAIELRVTRCTDDVETEVVRGGTVRSGAGVNVPSRRLTLPALTDRDRRLLPRALALRPDLVAQSFVRRAEDVAELREALGDAPATIVAKIETRPAVDDIERILTAAPAIMVARGDLGIEIPFEEVPIVQKELVARASARGVTSIVATQMLESMVHSPRPTRAEASDVANAVLDGATAILLSAETAIGAYPVESAATAMRIVRHAEAYQARRSPSRASDATG